MTGISTTPPAASPVEAGIEQSRRMVAAVRSETSGASPNNGAAAVATETPDAGPLMARMGIGCGFNDAA